jgi:cellulose synthase operon protein C
VRSPSRIRPVVAALALAAVLGSPPGRAEAFVWPNVPDQVARGLASSDPSERRLAAARIVDLPPEIGLGLAQKAMGDPDVEVRLRGAQAAVVLRLPRAGDQVIGWLSDSDGRLRLAACDVIRAAPTDRSVVALGRVLGDPDPHVRLAAAAAMGASGMSEAVSPLLGHLDDPAAEVREEVARALGRVGDARAVVPLIGKVQDSVPEVRRTVARALGELGDVRASSALMLALLDASAEVRLSAVTALGQLRSEEAVTTIAPLVEADPSADPSSGYYPGGRPPGASGVGTGEVRSAALRALGRIGSDAAVKVLVAALVKDDPSAPRSPVRDALAAAGKRAAAASIALLGGSPQGNAGAGAALVLGALHDKDGVPAVVHAMQRGAVPLRWGLEALAQIGSPAALPPVLEVLDDPDPAARKEAIRAAYALLDPAHPDGRPIDPARAALADAATPIDEKIELCRMLGRTGAARAQEILLPLVKARPAALRLAVIEALGTLHAGSAATDKALVEALDDEAPEVRLKAATALARVGGALAAPLLLDRLTVAAEQDRGALGIALSGALARAGEPGQKDASAALAERVRDAVAASPEAARDALIEGLGRMRAPEAGSALATLGGSSIDDRRKVAEALAGHPEAAAALVKLTADADPGVRANAVWSLGATGKKEHIAIVEKLVKDPDAAVAGNAAGALGRIAEREAGSADQAAAALCPALADERPYVRANAITGLSLAGARCEAGTVRDVLARDPSEAVRLAAADALWRGLARAGDKPDEADRRALARCTGEERDAAVATRCGKAPEAASGTEEVAVYVVPDSRSTPLARAPFALVRPDGLLRLGLADRRGELFETGVPRGVIRLGVPAALAR